MRGTQVEFRKAYCTCRVAIKLFATNFTLEGLATFSPLHMSENLLPILKTNRIKAGGKSSEGRLDRSRALAKEICMGRTRSFPRER